MPFFDCHGLLVLRRTGLPNWRMPSRPGRRPKKSTSGPGRKRLNADLDKASTHNERNAVRVTTDEGRSVTFVQVAGLVARRILCYAKVGERLEKGERYGFIRFGSRVDVYLPLDAEITVSIGDKVTGVMSTIARL